MLDVGWSELLVIGVVALIVVGPKDLPILFRRMGEFTGRMRSMAREFTSAMNQAADEAGMTQMRRDLQDIANPRDLGLDAMRSAARDFATGFGDAPTPTATSPAAGGATAPATPTGVPGGAPAATPAGDPAAAAYAATGAATGTATGTASGATSAAAPGAAQAAPAPAGAGAAHPAGPRPQAASQDDPQA